MSFPQAAQSNSAIISDGESLQERFARVEDLFVEDENQINVRISDIVEAGIDTTCISTLYHKTADLSAALTAGRTYKIRVISIFSEFTVGSLQITSDMMQALLVQYDVLPDFLSILFSFGSAPDIMEGSSSDLTVRCMGSVARKLCYQIRYPEEHGRRPNLVNGDVPRARSAPDPWSLRHLGVYHHSSQENDTFILLHSTKPQYSVVNCRIRQLEKSFSSSFGAPEVSNGNVNILRRDPHQMHLLFFSSYLDNWRRYLKYIGKCHAKEAMVINLEEANRSGLSFARVQILRNLHAKVLTAGAFCISNLEIVERLSKPIRRRRTLSNNVDADDECYCGMSTHASKLKGYVLSSEVLQKGIQNTIDLMGYAITLQSQQESHKVDEQLADMTKQMYRLATKADKTSGLINIITWIYIPGSFVTSLFGMNFFDFNEKTSRMSMAADFWIFFLVWIPAMFLTASLFVISERYYARAAGRPYDWPWTSVAKALSKPNVAKKFSTGEELHLRDLDV